jgi:hypothetical protein
VNRAAIVKPSPLALSDSQLDLVLTGARSVPVPQRERYLSAIADALTGWTRIRDEDVAAAVERGKFRFGVQL